MPVAAPHLEITSMSDIPAGTGLGSSRQFHMALLRALHTLNKEFVPRQELAEQACHIEIDLLGEPIGKQDQYIAVLRRHHVLSSSARTARVDVTPLQISTETLYNWKTTCCCSSPASPAPPRRSSRSRTRRRAAATAA